MASYVTAVAVAICMVLGLFIALEMTATNPIFAQELHNTPAHELILMAEDPECEDRVKVIQQLGRRPMSIDTIVPVLARLCLDKDPDVIAAAENTLNEMGKPAAEMLKPIFDDKSRGGMLVACSAAKAIGPPCKIFLPELKELLGGDKADRRGALFALSGIRDSGVELIDEVIECLSHQDFNVRCSACRVLETYGVKAAKAEDELIRMLEEDVPSVRGWAAICLAGIGPELKNKKADELIAKRLAGDGNRPVLPIEHQRYLAALVKFGDKSEKHLDTIRKGLEHRSAYVQGYSAFAVLQISGKTDEATEVLARLLNDKPRAPEALDMISQMGDKALPFASMVEGCLDAEFSETKVMALAALMSMGANEPGTINKVKPLLLDQDPEVQMAARKALRSMQGSETESADDSTGAKDATSAEDSTGGERPAGNR